MACQIERELHAGRELCKTLIDADLEEEGAVLMPQHDPCGHRRGARAQGDDLALANLGKRRSGAADEGGIAIVLRQRGAALALPAAGFEREEAFEGGRYLVLRSRDMEGHSAMLGEPVAL